MNFQAVLPWISFLIGIAVAVLQIYVTARLAKIKEDILTIVRHEFKEEIGELKKDMVTREVLDLRMKNQEWMLNNIQKALDQRLK